MIHYRSIQLRTLGSIDLEGRSGSDGADLPSQGKRLALLSYLAVEPGFIRRDLLLGLLWPELGPPNARRALRQSLHQLRKQLGEDVVETRGLDAVRLHPERFWCDARALNEAYDRGDWNSVVELYDGEFMPGFHVSSASPEFEFWLGETRHRLWRLALDAACGLAETARADGRLEDSLNWARRCCDLDPSDEELLRKYLRVLQRTGKISEALQAYELFARRLREDFSVEPSSETKDLVDRLRDRDPAGRRQRSPAHSQTDFPLFGSPLVGRKEELGELLTLVANPEIRLLTLSGPGGVGKTRLASELAQRCRNAFPGGMKFVALAPLREREVIDLLEDYSNSRSVSVGRRLLLLDNFEHVLGASSAVSSALWENEALTILTTSRELLRLDVEREISIDPLTLPYPNRRLGTGDLPLGSEAVALFVERARDADPTFRLTPENTGAVIEICRRLDCLPLAIELAAARMRSLTPEVLAERLAAGIYLLGPGLRDRDERQRTIDRTIQWSIDLLEPCERSLLLDLSVFSGGMRLEAIEAVCRSDSEDVVLPLSSLVEKHLLRRSEHGNGQPRFEMLETIRAYACRLRDQDSQHTDTLKRHAAHFAEWLEAGRRFFCTQEEARWHEEVDQEQDNVRTALRWCETHGDFETAARIVGGIGYFWLIKGSFREGLHWTRSLLGSKTELSSDLRSEVLTVAAWMSMGSGQAELSIPYLEECTALLRASGDQGPLIRGLINLGISYSENERINEARCVFEEALAIAKLEGDTVRMGSILCELGNLYRRQDLYEDAHRCLDEAWLVAETVGDRGHVARALEQLGVLHESEGDLESAESAMRRALGEFELLQQKIDVAQTLLWLGEIMRRKGRAAEFRAHTTDALHIYREIEYQPGIGQALIQLSRLALERGDAAEAVRNLSGVEANLGEEGLRTKPFYDRVLEIARDALPRPEFERAWVLGRRFTLDHLATRVSTLSPAVELRAVP